jgi:hypothetical protein
MSENHSLAVLEVLVHLSGTLPDKYVLGSADIPDNLIESCRRKSRGACRAAGSRKL